MPSLAQCKTDIDTVITDLGSTTAYASILPADLKAAANSGLKTSVITCWRLLSLLLHDAGFSNLPQTINSNQG